MTVAATIVVEFGQGVDSGALTLVELDEVMNLDGEGQAKSDFAPGDTPYFLVHHEPSVRIGSIACSSGMVTGGATVSRGRSQQLQWPTTEDSQELPHLPSGPPVTWQWWGNVPVIARDGRTLTASGTRIPAIGLASYQIAARQFRLIPRAMSLADGETYPILIVITMEAA